METSLPAESIGGEKPSSSSKPTHEGGSKPPPCGAPKLLEVEYGRIFNRLMHRVARSGQY
jgi:hypothetical protein